MNPIVAIAFGAIKSLLLKVVTEKFFIWLFFWSGEMIVEHTKTDKDDKFLEEVKRIYEGDGK